MEKITEEIGKIVTWYAKTKPNETQLIELLDNIDRLTALLWLYADFVAEAKVEYNRKYFVRKIEVSREKMNLVNSGLDMNKAETEAMLAKELEFEMEQEAEAVCYKADLLLKQGNRVVDAMRTRISFYKQEKQQSANLH
jgi:hypothetical protein